MDASDLLLSLITGLLASILIVGYTYSENNRSRLNHIIELLAVEINRNRIKLRNYKEEIEKVKKQWEETKNLSEIERDLEISKGYGDSIYNLFLFDAFHYFTSQGTNLDVNWGTDYSVKLFYHNCMRFCLNIQEIEKRIYENYENGLTSFVANEFRELEKEIDAISAEFYLHTFAPSPGNEPRRAKKITWFDWHIKRDRRVTYLFYVDYPAS